MTQHFFQSTNASFAQKAEYTLNNLKYQVLYGSEPYSVYIHMTNGESQTQEIETAVIATQESLGLQVAGYFTEIHGKYYYVMDRYFRRMNQEIKSIDEMKAIATKIKELVPSAEIQDHTQVDENVLKVDTFYKSVVGLSEGYYEGRKKQIIASIAKDSMTSSEAIAMIESMLETLSFGGVLLDEEMDIELITKTLNTVCLAIEHTTDDVELVLAKAHISGMMEQMMFVDDSVVNRSIHCAKDKMRKNCLVLAKQCTEVVLNMDDIENMWKVVPVKIFASYPGYTPYIENGCIVYCKDFDMIAYILDALKQARASVALYKDSVLSGISTLEPLEYSKRPSAK